ERAAVGARRRGGTGDARARRRASRGGGGGPHRERRPGRRRARGGGGLMTRTILCWVDAGAAVGLGHLSRTLALAEAATAHGFTCRFALPPDPTALRWLGAAGMPPPILLPERGAVLPQVLAAAASADAVIVDVRHRLAVAEVRALGTRCPVLVIDNAGDG